MTAGAQLSPGSINNGLGRLTAATEQVMQQMQAFTQAIFALGGGGQANVVNALVAMGFSSADATDCWNQCGHLATVCGVYFGTVQQGGTGGTGATMFSFSSALATARGAVVNL